jgi:thymidylate synthase
MPILSDQIRWVIKEAKNNPGSRRLVVAAWSPGEAQVSKHPPSNVSMILNVQQELTGVDGESYAPCLCLHVLQRSCDVLNGLPYNIAGCALLLSLFVRFLNSAGLELNPGWIAHTLVDAHLYRADVQEAKRVTQASPVDLPQLHINDRIQTLEDAQDLLELETDELMELFTLLPHGASE